MEAHLHIHQHREVSRDLRAAHQFQQDLDCNGRVVLHKLRELPRGQTAVVDQLGVLLEPAEDDLLLRGGQGCLHGLGDQLPDLRAERGVRAHGVVPHGLAEDMRGAEPERLVDRRLQERGHRAGPRRLQRQQAELLGPQVRARRRVPLAATAAAGLAQGVPDGRPDAQGGAGEHLGGALLVHPAEGVQVGDRRDLRRVVASQEIRDALLRQLLWRGCEELQQELSLDSVVGLLHSLQYNGNKRSCWQGLIPVDVIQKIEANDPLGLRQQLVLQQHAYDASYLELLRLWERPVEGLCDVLERLAALLQETEQCV
mmetsp:Transcript_25819/g.80510  ORF Transcript_25819/g.80510 Transcript_25819/m.80510 type:complete len:313 (-) Transcript_25819:54-992(-)